jgi:hypothetical protein
MKFERDRARTGSGARAQPNHPGDGQRRAHESAQALRGPWSHGGRLAPRAGLGRARCGFGFRGLRRRGLLR